MSPDLPHDLGGGLVMRRATAGDLPRILALHTETFGSGAHPYRLTADECQLRDLLERPHPTFHGTEMTIVEEKPSGRIVSSQHLSHHVWAYDGVHIPVGEIEHVSTSPDFRRRGLVRRQTEVMHRWSEAAGEPASAVNGIPWYYTQFGYELPLDKYGGCRLLGEYAGQTRPQDAPFSVRPAIAGDVDTIARIYDSAAARFRISYVRTIAHWEYELCRRDPHSSWYRSIFVLDDEGTTVGFCSLNPLTDAIDAFEVLPGVPWSLATCSLARWLLSRARPDSADGGREVRSSWRFDWLGEAHPAFRACPHLFGKSETLGTSLRTGAWYVRVVRLDAFVELLVPALEATLARSDEAGYSGTIRVGRYRDPGLELTLERGRIAVAPWTQEGLHDGDARFADGTFLELLFGRTDLASLEAAFPYRVGVLPHARPVLNALFPRRPSFLLPVY